MIDVALESINRALLSLDERESQDAAFRLQVAASALEAARIVCLMLESGEIPIA